MSVSDIPEYEKLSEKMLKERSLWAKNFADQIELTLKPYLNKPLKESRILDLGCGYGFTANELAQRSESVIGIEPSGSLFDYAQKNYGQVENISFLNGTLESLQAGEKFDVVILDNVFEHIPNQKEVLVQIEHCLNDKGLVFMLMPNKLWPIEVHYGLPFLSYLPVPLANIYLKISGKGSDYTDASYAPTYWGLRRMIKKTPGLEGNFVLPGDVNLAKGAGTVYKLGVYMISKFPIMWMISKAFLVVVKKQERHD